ncbi:MAG: N-acetylmuramoyl-L-alanine amidase [Acidobacteria bacterium]|nr:MAG: N-acetylmuramoyl-L-alanine amidase [Acidobacteriota bacterium]REK03708.1 MAG: N-acetylmuramoyl-L-alanine amidase [Acidobacteriota bacterium]
MLRSPRWRARALLAPLALLLSPHLLSAQEEEPEEPPPPIVAEAGVGRLFFDGREATVPYSLTAGGDYVGLEAVTAMVGGELEVGPLGLGHTLRLFGDEVVFGPTSAVLTIGDEIVPISSPPLGSPTGIQVPIDFLRRVYTERFGYVFDWSRPRRTLVVQRREGRQLAVETSAVRIAGVTHLVLQFSGEPDARISRTPVGDLRLVFPGDTLNLRGELPRSDSLLRAVTVSNDAIQVRLQPGAEAAEPLRVARGGNVRLVIDISPQRVVSTPPESRPLTGFTGLRIVIDPGHGGNDVGAVGSGGTLEKDLNLTIARTLERRLEARLPVEALLTREHDVALDHSTRTAIANQNEASLFISLHFNSELGSTARGAETYFLDQDPSDEAAAQAAQFENEVVGADSARGATDELGLQLMLWDLAQSRHLSESQRFATLVQQQLNATLGLRDRGVKQAPFRVLVGATMPAVLVELGFLSNPAEEEKLGDPAYRLQLVDALVDAVAEYRGSLAADEREAGASLDAGAQP